MLSVRSVGKPEVTAQVGRSEERNGNCSTVTTVFFDLRISPQESDIRLDIAIRKSRSQPDVTNEEHTTAYRFVPILCLYNRP
jgi:hypothetical protein